MTIVKTNTFVKIYDSSQYNIQICNKKKAHLNVVKLIFLELHFKLIEQLLDN